MDVVSGLWKEFQVIQETSLEAFEKVKASLPEMQRLVYNSICIVGPSTADEVASITGLHILNARPAVTMLRRRGLIRDSGVRRNSSLGNSSIVWEVGGKTEKATLCPTCGRRLK